MKKARAKRKANTEYEMGAQKEKEIEKLTQKIEQLKNEVVKQKKNIKKFKIYQAFIETILDYTDEVSEVEINLVINYYYNY